MIGNSKRSIRLLSWRTLRWAIALPTLPLVWWACTSHPLAQPVPSPEQQTDIYISVAPNRLLDLVFMVDNSPSMAPKVDKMNAQFPKLIAALKDPSDNTLPDLRVAIIDSDLGTGGQYPNGSCGPNTSNGMSNFGDQGKFRMLNASTCGVTSADAIYLETKGNTGLNFSGDINTVFACLAKGLGTQGCGEEHQLQAFEFALVAGGLGNEEQHKMLRGNAYLGLVFLTDEDDCSAAMNDGMFGDTNHPELRNESASLRCATRAHQCGGRSLTETPPGYPTTDKFEADFSSCKAREDSCPNQTDGNGSTDTTGPTSCSPLKSIKNLANELKGLKSVPEEQILVAGIFGWPLSDAEMANAKYKIEQIPNPNTADTSHPTVFDYLPVCYDPNHKPASANTYDPAAAGWGAQGGLRLSSFIDEFGENGLKFSICQTDFTESMKKIGDTIAKKLQNLCVNYKLVDTDLGADGLQPDCRVVYRKPVTDDKGNLSYEESPTSLPICAGNASPDNISEDCWQLTSDKTKCPDAYNGQLITVIRPRKDMGTPLTPGTKVGMQCRTCTDFLTPNPDTTSPTKMIPLPGC